MTNYPGKGKVAVLKTSPTTVLDDIERLMKLAEFETALSKDVRTGLKINISWQTWYPACSSTPWQLEGVIRTLQRNGYTDLVGVHNDTVVVNTADGVHEQFPHRRDRCAGGQVRHRAGRRLPARL